MDATYLRVLTYLSGVASDAVTAQLRTEDSGLLMHYLPAHQRVAPELTLAAHARAVESMRHAVLVGAGEHARAHRQPHERSNARARWDAQHESPVQGEAQT